ncbi:MAG: calcium-binding protein [Acetobacteraceae bacterium]
MAEQPTEVYFGKTSDMKQQLADLAGNVMVGVPTQVINQLINENGGAPLPIRFIIRAPNAVYQTAINLTRQDTGDPWKAVVLGTTDFVSGAIVSTTVSSAMALGFGALGLANLPLTLAVGIGTAIWIYARGDSVESFVNTMHDVASLWYDGDLGVREYLNEKAIAILEKFDGIFSTADNSIPVSDLIASAANYFPSIQWSPITLDLDGDGKLNLLSDVDGVHFDIDHDGYAEKIGWVSPADGLLAVDTNGNGVIDNQGELFGNDAASLATAKLLALDANQDGVVDAQDPGYAALLAWQDKNTNGLTDAGELTALSTLGITLQAVPTGTAHSTDPTGNTINWTGSFTQNGSTHKLGDVSFTTHQYDSWYVGSDTSTLFPVDPNVFLLPNSRGYGNVKALHLALTENPTLRNAVAAFDALTPANIAGADNAIVSILALWAGTEGVAPESGGKYFNQQYLATLEKFLDVDYTSNNADGIIRQYPQSEGSSGAATLSNAWTPLFGELKARLEAQGPLQPVFANSYYSFASDRIIFNEDLSAILARATTLAPADANQAAAYWGDVGNVLLHGTDQLGDPATIQAALDAAAGAHVRVYEGYYIGLATGETTAGSVRNDMMLAGAGASKISGAEGDDYLLGGPGDDTLYGDTAGDTQGGGNDLVIGAAGDDQLFGGSGDDTLQGGDGDDTLTGNNGNDRLSGDAGEDRLYGSNGDDYLLGGDGNDRLYGGAGMDFLYGGPGRDTLEGGSGADVFHWAAASEAGLEADRDEVADFSAAEGDILQFDPGLALSFIGEQPFTGGGQHQIQASAISGGYLLRIDSDGNALADMEIRLSGLRTAPAATDFRL